MKFLIMCALTLLSACAEVPVTSRTSTSAPVQSTNDINCTDKLRSLKKPNADECSSGKNCDSYVRAMKDYDKASETIQAECISRYQPTLSAPIK